VAVEVYRLTAKGSLYRDHALRDQMRRSAVSVPSNIAEGDERDAVKDSIRFFRYAKGSVAELQTQLEIAVDVGFLSPDSTGKAEQQLGILSRKLASLINSRLNKLNLSK